eukprot:2910386-Amphidinium_carterae.1
MHHMEQLALTLGLSSMTLLLHDLFVHSHSPKIEMRCASIAKNATNMLAVHCGGSSTPWG